MKETLMSWQVHFSGMEQVFEGNLGVKAKREILKKNDSKTQKASYIMCILWSWSKPQCSTRGQVGWNVISADTKKVYDFLPAFCT